MGFGVFMVISAAVIAALFPLQYKLQAAQSGWGSLAERYRHDTMFDGRTWTWCAIFRNRTTYDEWSLKIGANAEGLYLAQRWPVSYGHPPLLVPWRDVAIREKRWTAWGSATMYLGGDLAIEMTLVGKITPEFMNHVQGLHAGPGPSTGGSLSDASHAR